MKKKSSQKKQEKTPVRRVPPWAMVLSGALVLVALAAIWYIWYMNRVPQLELPYLTARHAIVMEVESGKILYEKDSDTPHSPASLTKLMTLLLVYEDLKNGVLRWEDTYTVTPQEAQALGSKYGMYPGEVFTLRQLIAGAALSSGCDCIQCLVQMCAEDEATFISRMNEKAAELGMRGTNFANATGIDAVDHYMTARDVAALARELVLEYPEILEFTSRSKMVEDGRVFQNTHKLVGHDERILGLKTGTTQVGGYNLVTCVREGDRLYLIVLLNCSSDTARFSETGTIIDALAEAS